MFDEGIKKGEGGGKKIKSTVEEGISNVASGSEWSCECQVCGA